MFLFYSVVTTLFLNTKLHFFPFFSRDRLPHVLRFYLRKFKNIPEYLKFSNFVNVLSLRIFRQLTSSSLLYSQCFGRYALRPSSCVSYQIWEPTQNLELNPLFNHWVDCSDSYNHDRVQVLWYTKYSLLFLPVVGIEPATFVNSFQLSTKCVSFSVSYDANCAK